MLAYTCICGTVSMRYRSSETNYQYEYRHMYYGCLLTAGRVVVFYQTFYCCNLLIRVGSMIIVRSVWYHTCENLFFILF